MEINNKNNKLNHIFYEIEMLTYCANHLLSIKLESFDENVYLESFLKISIIIDVSMNI